MHEQRSVEPAHARNLFTGRSGAPDTPSTRRVLLAPSILAADFARISDECHAALHAGSDLLHLDVMDGHFVPNLTMGPDLCRALRGVLPSAMLDVHLMVTDPGMFIEPFARAGADHVTLHAEVLTISAALRLADRARALGMTTGLAINPPTDPSPWIPALGLFDLALVMSVNPGFAGQSFIAHVLDKVRAIRARWPGLRIQMDGGLGPSTAPQAIDAGCDVLVAGSAFFAQPRQSWPALARSLRSAS